KVQGSSGPAVGVEEPPVVLVSSGEIAVNPPDDRGGKLRYRILLCDGSDQAGGPLKQVDSLLVPTGEVMESSFNSNRVCGSQRVDLWIEHGERLAKMIQPALISGRDQRSRRQGM